MFPQDDPNLELANTTSEGRGEDHPYLFIDSEKEKPYQQDDKRRRICKMYAYVLIEDNIQLTNPD